MKQNRQKWACPTPSKPEHRHRPESKIYRDRLKLEEGTLLVRLGLGDAA